MKKIILTMLFVALSSALALAGPETYTKVHLKVIPGVSAGPIKLGEYVSPEVYELLGPPTRKSDSVILWTEADEAEFVTGILVKLDPQGRARAVWLADVNATTNKGVRLGDSRTSVERSHPNARFNAGRGGDHLDVPGMSIGLDRNHHVESFNLW